jgi:hypothetical protein
VTVDTEISNFRPRSEQTKKTSMRQSVVRRQRRKLSTGSVDGLRHLLHEQSGDSSMTDLRDNRATLQDDIFLTENFEP